MVRISTESSAIRLPFKELDRDQWARLFSSCPTARKSKESKVGCKDSCGEVVALIPDAKRVRTPTQSRSVLPAFFVAKLSTLDEEQELGDAAPEGDPTGNTVPFASEESAEAGQASDELEHGPVGGRPALGVLR